MRIFISYSRTDTEILKKLVPLIQANYGDECVWYDEKIQGGNAWWETILQEIKRCNIFMFLISDTALESKYCQQELQEAVEKEKHILPVIIRKLDQLYPGNISYDLADILSSTHYVDLTNGVEDTASFAKLSSAINQLNLKSLQGPIQLTRKDRWILSNQLMILAGLYPQEAEEYLEMKEIIDYGYELHYNWISQHVLEDKYTLNEKDCIEVLNILDMFSVVKRTYEELVDKAGIDDWTVSFSGFDGNNESLQFGYTYFLVKKQGKFHWVIQDNQFNSHAPVLDSYRRMVEAWRESKNQYELTKDDIIRITKARRGQR